jgi:hypothetical protein
MMTPMPNRRRTDRPGRGDGRAQHSPAPLPCLRSQPPPRTSVS